MSSRTGASNAGRGRAPLASWVAIDQVSAPGIGRVPAIDRP